MRSIWCVTALTAFSGRTVVKVHRGFYEGAKRHLEEIAAVVRARDSAAGKRLPVWVTGHSLGGGYANALALHLLANRATAELFGAGADQLL
jgi:predicted alpha/beta-fold hydrolase